MRRGVSIRTRQMQHRRITDYDAYSAFFKTCDFHKWVAKCYLFRWYYRQLCVFWLQRSCSTSTILFPNPYRSYGAPLLNWAWEVFQVEERQCIFERQSRGPSVHGLQGLSSSNSSSLFLMNFKGKKLRNFLFLAQHHAPSRSCQMG